MLQSTSAATVTRGKTPPRHRKRAPTSRAPRHIEAADEPVDGNDGAVLVTFIEAERMLRVSRQTLHNLIVAGSLRVRRFGRAVRIPTSELERLAKPGSTPTKPRRQQAAE
jgi:excisionase family DNA binding protein